VYTYLYMLDGYSTGIYQDNGCKDAENFLGYKVKCTTGCPFGDCIHDLKPAEKQLILQNNIVRTALMYYNLGMSIKEIILFMPTITPPKIRYWINNRNKIEYKLNKYAPVGV